MAPPFGFSPTIEFAIHEAYERASLAHPHVLLPSSRFAEHVQRVDADPEHLLRYGPDLFLACGCLGGDPTALRQLDRELFPKLRDHLSRMKIDDSLIDEALQQVRILLFTPPALQIARYAARGPLRSWLTTVASRVALKVLSEARRNASFGDELRNHLVATADPGLVVLSARVGAEFQRALDDSIGALTGQARAVLRLRYVHGLDIDAIGTLYQVHRATAARWLAAARTVILANLRDNLSSTLRPTSSELTSLATALEKDLHLSLDRLLAPDATDAAVVDFRATTT